MAIEKQTGRFLEEPSGLTVFRQGKAPETSRFARPETIRDTNTFLPSIAKNFADAAPERAMVCHFATESVNWQKAFTAAPRRGRKGSRPA